MPCYDPVPSKELEMYPNWLCQAFKLLTREQIKSIRGILDGYSKESAFDWYAAHLHRENNVDEAKRIGIIND